MINRGRNRGSKQKKSYFSIRWICLNAFYLDIKIISLETFQRLYAIEKFPDRLNLNWHLNMRWIKNVKDVRLHWKYVKGQIYILTLFLLLCLAVWCWPRGCSNVRPSLQRSTKSVATRRVLYSVHNRCRGRKDVESCNCLLWSIITSII